MYTIEWRDREMITPERERVQYLADVYAVVRDAFGCDDAVVVTIVKESND